ncbi:MAG: DUF2029 domain-containing protein [Chloroflexota bacterium]|nr:MAG: DUF2029 domain-containing protein [Chloroflexota bacterium]
MAFGIICLLLLVIMAWLALRRERYATAGLMIGLLVALKPQFAVWPGLLLMAGYYRTVLAAAAAGLAAGVVPAVVYGPDIYARWLSVTTASTRAFGSGGNASLVGLATRLGVPILGLALSALLLVGLVLWSWWRRPDALRLTGISLAAMMLASPLGWIGNTIWLLPVFFARRWTPTLWCAALLLLLPYFSPLHVALLGLPYTAAILSVLLDSMVGERRERRVASVPNLSTDGRALPALR